ncbi:MAG: tetratricopeptide repeat protein [Deltaproteobacteria bacterium]|nr:tetratricopeptide repeat protein [Deltaproteobacteria bacterium]
MTGQRPIELDGVRADGWFERVVANVPALGRLCEGIGEALVALSLVAGFRIVSAGVDRGSGEITTLQWVRDSSDGTEVSDSGAPEALRQEVLAALLGEADVLGDLPEEPDAAALRTFLGQRYVLLAPLFGLTLQRLEVSSGAWDEAVLVVKHDGTEDSVGLRQFRRFLRSRVIDALQAQKNKSVSIDLEQAEQARQAFHAGRYDEVVARLSGWVAPLLMYLRTPEAAALEPRTRADLARALEVLGEALDRLTRAEEAEETLRLGVQYAHDGPAAAELYRALARHLLSHDRPGEALGPLRRSLALEPAVKDLLPELAQAFLDTRRAVAALGCLRELRAAGFTGPRMDALEGNLKERFGERLERFSRHVGG